MRKAPKLGVNDALRRAGYKRLPAWWVTEAEFEAIYRMAHNHQREVNRIRALTKRGDADDDT